MLPLLPFATGLVAGALAVRLLRSPAARHYLDGLRQQLQQVAPVAQQQSSATPPDGGQPAAAPDQPAPKRRPRKPRGELPEVP